MNKLIFIIFGLLLTQSLWAEFALTSDSYNPFKGELVEIAAIVPNVDLNSPYKLIIENATYDLIKEKKYEYTKKIMKQVNHYLI